MTPTPTSPPRDAAPSAAAAPASSGKEAELQRWLPPLTPEQSLARIQLWCFPFASGSAAIFHPWRKLAPPWLAVRPVMLPGRERRITEPAHRDIASLIEAAADALAPAMTPHVVFFGYSMGALLAFELARAMRRRGLPLPAHLLVAAHRAPQLPETLPPLHKLPDLELKEGVKNRFGNAGEALDHPDLAKLLMPLLRADMTLCESYPYRAEPALDCPISVAGAEDDPVIPIDQLHAWSEQCRRPVSVSTFRGGHFFFQTQPQDLLAWALLRLEETAGPGGGGTR